MTSDEHPVSPACGQLNLTTEQQQRVNSEAREILASRNPLVTDQEQAAALSAALRRVERDGTSP